MLDLVVEAGLDMAVLFLLILGHHENVSIKHKQSIKMINQLD